MLQRLKYLLKKYYPLLIISIGIMIGITLVTVPLMDTLADNLTLKYFIVAQYIGYLFFILSFVELMFIKFIMAGFDPLTICFFAVTMALLAQTTDYFIGYIFSNKVTKKIIGQKKYEKSKYKIEKYGDLTIFVFNVLPLSSPLLVTVAGMLRYKFKKVLIYSFLGLTIKYVTIALFIKHFVL